MPFAFLHSNGSSGNEIKKNYRARESEGEEKNEEIFTIKDIEEK